MKFKILIVLAFVLSLFFTSCTDDTTAIGNWVSLPFYSGDPRAYGTCFEFDTIAFYGMGKDDDEYLPDFWKYSLARGKWTRADSFPGLPRAYGISVSTSTKGYAGLGYGYVEDGSRLDDFTDFWEYDPIADTWTQLADFPGGKRRNASAFAIGEDVYVGLGVMENGDVYMNDFWKYSNGQWSEATPLSGDKRANANIVAYKGDVFVIGGYHSTTLSDMWKFLPATEQWKPIKTKLNDEDLGDANVPRFDACAFVSEGSIYLAGGTQGTATLSTVYGWNDTDSTWTEKTRIETGTTRAGAGCFTIGGSGYIVGGRSGVKYLADFYRFEPMVEKDLDDNY